jgi:uncharacterized protein (DUF2147 family)
MAEVGMHRLATCVALIGVAFGSLAAAQTPTPNAPLGRWLTESKRGVIDIYPCADKVCGKLVWMIEPLRQGAPVTDENNPDRTLRKRPLCGVAMLGNFHQVDPRHWDGGWIYDPDSGKTYQGMFTLDGNEIQIRGFLVDPYFGQTQTWTRPDASYTSC